MSTKEIVTKGKYFLGEYEGGKCYLTWELKKGEKGLCFSMCGERWESNSERQRGRERDVTECGQCCNRIAGYFPEDKRAARMVEIWERYHLNDMRAGTPGQEGAIKAFKAMGWKYDYSEACAKLAAIGLNPDKGYEYGHAWLFEEIPADIIKEIKRWKNPEDMTADELRDALE